MGRCFKLLGKAKKEQKAVDCTGSAFFVAEHYLLTCKHNVSALFPGDKLSVCYGNNKYSAELMDTAEDWDLALLYTETSAEEDWIFLLDRIATEGREAIAYGYPHGGVLDEQRGLVIGTELDNGVANLTNANGVTIGFSGGPVCLAKDKGTAVGVIITIKGRDEFGRQVETAGFVYIRVALELWGEQYNLCEKRYEERTDVYGSNSFVYSERKTDFQDPYNYLEQLQSFLNDSRPVLWWAVVGPGGSGKSRLCYELARSLNSNWRCEPLRSGQLNKAYLQNLYDKAGRDFLLLADYAYADTGELGDWLDERARARDDKDRPRIRVLLLQREKGRKDFGWEQSLMRGHGNLINLRYREDLELAVMQKKEMTALMRSYARNKAGRQINAEELYEVLQSVDPGLTRPLFAMFIVDADLRGDDLRGWDPEKALAYFTQREKDIVDRAFLDRPEDASAAKLLLVLATICGGFTFDAGLLNSSPLNGIQEFMELQDITNFGSRMNKTRLAESYHRHYTVKPLKPDLLGEYYVLDSFKEMLNDSQRKESISVLLNVAYEADSTAACDFLTRLFTDYETDDSLACLCCGENNWFHYSVSWGLVMRPDAAVLCKLYRKYGIEFWLEQYAKGLFNSIVDKNDPEKAEGLLEELRELHREKPGNTEVSDMLARGLFKVINDQNHPEQADKLLEEIRELHRGEPGNAEISRTLAGGLVNALKNKYNSKQAEELLEELRELHRGEPGNAEVSTRLALGLLYTFYNQRVPKQAEKLLEELRELHRDEPGNAEVSGLLANELFNTLYNQSDTDKEEKLLEELRELHREEPGNAEISIELAMGLFKASSEQSDPEKAEELVKELRELHREEPGNAELSGFFAGGLFIAFSNQRDPEQAENFLDEIRLLHREEPGNKEISIWLANGLDIALIRQNNPEQAEALLAELRELHREEPGNAEVTGKFAEVLSNAFYHQSNPEKAKELLEELRELSRDISGDARVSGKLVDALSNAFYRQNDPEKAEKLLEVLRGLHKDEPGSTKISGLLAEWLLHAFNNHSDSEKTEELLEELRGLHRDNPGSEGITIEFANGLLFAFNNQSDPEKAEELLEELRGLHRDDPGSEGITIVFAQGLINAFYRQSDLEMEEELLEEFHELQRDEPDNKKLLISLAYMLVKPIGFWSNLEKTDKLLVELRELHRDEPGIEMISIALARGLGNSIGIQKDPDKAEKLLEELRELHRDEPGNTEITWVLDNVIGK